VFWFPPQQIFSQIFFTLRRIDRDIIKNVPTSSCKVTVTLIRFLWNLNFLDRFSKKKNSNITCHENLSSWSRDSPWTRADTQADGQTDRHNEGNSRFPWFCKRTSKRTLVVTESMKLIYLLKNRNQTLEAITKFIVSEIIILAGRSSSCPPLHSPDQSPQSSLYSLPRHSLHDTNTPFLIYFFPWRYNP
jgi:hypothetical protein